MRMVPLFLIWSCVRPSNDPGCAGACETDLETGGIRDSDSGRIDTGSATDTGDCSVVFVQPPYVRASNVGACMLDAQGRVTCWGDSEPFESPVGFVEEAPTGTYTFLDTRGSACVLEASGDSYCWPDELTRSSVAESLAKRTPSAIIVQGKAGYTLDACGQLDCFGDSGSSILKDVPTGRFSHVAAGRYAACAIDLPGTLQCWGEEFAYEDLASQAGTWRHVDTEHVTSCGIGPDGIIHCAGLSEHITNNVPVLDNPVEVSLGDRHACARTEAGTVHCWGISDGSDFDWGQVTDVPPMTGVISISSTAYLSCALLSTGRALCWGDPRWGHQDVP